MKKILVALVALTFFAATTAFAEDAADDKGKKEEKKEEKEKKKDEKKGSSEGSTTWPGPGNKA